MYILRIFEMNFFLMIINNYIIINSRLGNLWAWTGSEDIALLSLLYYVVLLAPHINPIQKLFQMLF